MTRRSYPFPAVAALLIVLLSGAAAAWLGPAPSAIARQAGLLADAAAAERALEDAIARLWAADHAPLAAACRTPAVDQRLADLRRARAELVARIDAALDARQRVSNSLPGRRVAAAGSLTAEAGGRALGALFGVVERAEIVRAELDKEIDYYLGLPPCGEPAAAAGRLGPGAKVWPSPFSGDPPGTPRAPPPPLPPCLTDDARAEIRDLPASIEALEAELEAAVADFAGGRDRLADLLKAEAAPHRMLAQQRALDEVVARMKALAVRMKAMEARLEALRTLPPCGAPAAGGQCLARPPGPLEQGVLRALNDARADPAGFAALLREGPAAEVAEARDFLRRQAPAPAVAFSPRLMAAADRQLTDIRATGKVGHAGRDGSGPLKRAQQAGLWSMTVAEEIAVGPSGGPGVVGVLIIDAGQPARPHRKDLFDARLVHGGVACGPVPRAGAVCVIVLSGPIVRETDGEGPWRPCPPP